MQEVDLFVMFHPFIHIHSSISQAKGHDQDQKCLSHIFFLRCAPLMDIVVPKLTLKKALEATCDDYCLFIKKLPTLAPY